MKENYPENWPQFYTATIKGWKHLFKEDKYKEVICSTLQYLVEYKKVKVNAFVPIVFGMSNYVHFIWQALHGFTLNQIQTSFKKHTSKQFLALLKIDTHIDLFQVSTADRKHHFWKRNSLGIELFTEAVFIQKFNYIQLNPVIAWLCGYPSDYKYLSALFYLKGIRRFNFTN